MAKKLILEAKKAGAIMAKMQAIDPDVVSLTGSMPYEFYKACELTTNQYLECQAYGRSLGIPVFFSVFGTKHKLVSRVFQNSYHKISGGQFLKMSTEELHKYNTPYTIISIPESAGVVDGVRARAIWAMQKMFVTPYLPTSVNWEYLIDLRLTFSQMGYSDHTPGIESCKEAIGKYGCRLIEKHFHLGTDIVWEGVRYRDCLHAATPSELAELTSFYKKVVR